MLYQHVINQVNAEGDRFGACGAAQDLSLIVSRGQSAAAPWRPREPSWVWERKAGQVLFTRAREGTAPLPGPRLMSSKRVERARFRRTVSPGLRELRARYPNRLRVTTGSPSSCAFATTISWRSRTAASRPAGPTYAVGFRAGPMPTPEARRRGRVAPSRPRWRTGRRRAGLPDPGAGKPDPGQRWSSWSRC